MLELKTFRSWCVNNAIDEWICGRGERGMTFGFKSEYYKKTTELFEYCILNDHGAATKDCLKWCDLNCFEEWYWSYSEDYTMVKFLFNSKSDATFFKLFFT